MFFKKKVVIVLASTLLLSSCAAVSELLPEKKAVSVLSGRVGIDGQLLVVKVDDTNNAHPQIGLEDAEIIFIEQVEGGLTRLAAVYSTVIPERVGPVRSARISDIELLSQFGRVAFAYSGAQKKLLPVIAAANLQDFGAQRQSPKLYTTDPTRNAPYAMVLRTDLLMQKIKDEKSNVDVAKSIGYEFGDLPSGGAPTDAVVMNWPAATYLAIWSQNESRWLLTHNQKLNIADSGEVLGPTTLIIQMVEITDSGYRDKFAGVTPLSKTVGSGKAYVLRNGEMFQTRWDRAFEDSGTSFTLADGSVMRFDPGQIWVALTDREPEFTSRVSVKTK